MNFLFSNVLKRRLLPFIIQRRMQRTFVPVETIGKKRFQQGALNKIIQICTYALPAITMPGSRFRKPAFLFLYLLVNL